MTPECDTLNQSGVGTCWHAQLSLPAGSGPNDIKMDWEETSGCLMPAGCTKPSDFCKAGNGNKCTGNFENGVVIQRAYSASDSDTGSSSGPIKIVKVYKCDADPTCAQSDLQSYPVDSTHTFGVSIGIAGILRNATSVADPLVVLRVKSQTGQSLDCDDRYTNLKTEFALGCRPTYIPNTGTPDCSTIGTSALWAIPAALALRGRQHREAPNDVPAGLNQRILLDDKAKTCPALGRERPQQLVAVRPNRPQPRRDLRVSHQGIAGFWMRT